MDVLVVEPDADLGAAVGEAVREGGHVPHSVPDGAAALHLRNRIRAPVIVLADADLRDPRFTGFELCRRLAVRQGELSPAILMVRDPTRDVVIRAIRSGASDVLCVPFKSHDLPGKLNKMAARLASGRTGVRDSAPAAPGTATVSRSGRIDAMVEKATALRALPHAVANIVKLVGNEDTSAAELAHASESDPAIAAIILKLANSSWFRRGKAITRLKDAVVRLGFQECRKLVISLSVVKLFSRDQTTFAFNRLWFWVHSIACAVLARDICEQAGVAEPEEAFTVGLLHDIGKITLDDFLPELYAEALKTASLNKIPLYDAELAILDGTHAAVGRTLVDRWGFAERVGASITNHHNHARYLHRAGHTADLAGAVYLANQMAKTLMLGCAGDFLIQDVPDAVWQAYGFHGPPGDAFLRKFYAQVGAFCELVQITEGVIGQRLTPPEPRGTAALVDPLHQDAFLPALFLANQGFVVEKAESLAELTERKVPFDFCLMRLPSRMAAHRAILDLQSIRGGEIPSVWIFPEPMEALDVGTNEPRVRVLSAPIDCFQLYSSLCELVNPATPVSASGAGTTAGPSEASAGSQRGRPGRRVRSDSLAALGRMTRLVPDKEELLTLINRRVTLKPMQPVVQAVMDATARAGCSAEDVAREVSRDQSLSLRVLKLANSSTYSRGRYTDSMAQAVARIGTQEVRRLVMALGVIDGQGAELPGVVDADLFWQHSIACGHLAAALARTSGATSSEEHFLWGLTHDVGRLLLIEHAREAYATVAQTADSLGLPMEVVEEQLLRVNHCSVLDSALGHWGFPPEFRIPVVNHHRSVEQLKRLEGTRARAAMTVALADRLTHAQALGSSGNDVLYPLGDLARALDVQPATVAGIAGSAEKEVQELKLAIMARGSKETWRDRAAELRERLAVPLRPLCVSAEPALDPYRMFCERIAAPAGDPPNVGVVYLRGPRELSRLAGGFEEQERQAGAGGLPLMLIVNQAEGALDQDWLRSREHVVLETPTRVTDLLEAIRGLVGDYAVA